MCQNEKHSSSSCHLGRRRFITRSMLVAAGLVVAPVILIERGALAGGLFDFTPSVDQQKKLGLQASDQILKQYKKVHDSRSGELTRVGQRLFSNLPSDDQKKWDYHFHLIDSKEVNAFALPGGPVFMFSGLYDRVDSEDGLAAVTGHEMTHIRKEHWAKAYNQQKQRQVGIAAVLSITHANTNVQSAAGLMDSMIGLKYSRGEEDQADAGGLDDMVASNYNPQGMVEMFQMLKQVAGNGDTMGSDFLSNHPLTTDRIKHTEDRIAALQGKSFPAITPLPADAHGSPS